MTELTPLNTRPLPLPLRIEDYLALDRAGAFQAYRKTELLGGSVFFMNAQQRPHARIKSRLHLALAGAIDRAGVDLEALVEGSIAIPPHNVPEPDIVVTDAAEGTGLIPVTSVKLVIEVSDTTLDTDLREKQALYARAGIREYWVVDVQRRVVHQMWHPQGESFLERSEVTVGSAIVSAAISGLVVATTGL